MEEQKRTWKSSHSSGFRQTLQNNEHSSSNNHNNRSKNNIPVLNSTGRRSSINNSNKTGFSFPQSDGGLTDILENAFDNRPRSIVNRSNILGKVNEEKDKMDELSFAETLDNISLRSSTSSWNKNNDMNRRRLEPERVSSFLDAIPTRKLWPYAWILVVGILLMLLLNNTRKFHVLNPTTNRSMEGTPTFVETTSKSYYNYPTESAKTKDQAEETKVSPGDIAVAVVTFKGRQEETIRAIRDTWGSDFPKIEYVSGTAKEGIITVVVPENSTYARSSWEEMNALKVLHDKYPDSPWYMKADDDSYVNVKTILKILEGYDSNEIHYIGKVIPWEKDNHNYCAGGVGYILSNAAMKKLYPRLLEPLKSCCSDVQVGRLLSEELNNSAPCVAAKDFVYVAREFRAYMSSVSGKLVFSPPPYLERSEGELAKKVLLEKVVGFHYVSADMQYALRIFYVFSKNNES